jgi:hypothetical protein
MKDGWRFGRILLIVISLLSVATLTGAQTPANMPSALATVEGGLAILNAVPELPDDPLLDASGNVVLDAFGNPVSDPKETFHVVKPAEFDPAKTYLVQAAWLSGTGCPANANIAVYPSTTPTGTFSDTVCAAMFDPKDQHNEGLLLFKTGPTANNAAAVAELKKVKGLILTELGYDIRKLPDRFAPNGSHCGAGAPRFNVITDDGVLFFIGCQSPPPTLEVDGVPGSGDAWIRLRWGTGLAGSVFGFCVNPTTTPTTACPANFSLVPITGTVRRMQIVFDEGSDTGPDFFGGAVLDNIDVNGMLVGRGATEAS